MVQGLITLSATALSCCPTARGEGRGPWDRDHRTRDVFCEKRRRPHWVRLSKQAWCLPLQQPESRGSLGAGQREAPGQGPFPEGLTAARWRRAGPPLSAPRARGSGARPGPRPSRGDESPAGARRGGGGRAAGGEHGRRCRRRRRRRARQRRGRAAGQRPRRAENSLGEQRAPAARRRPGAAVPAAANGDVRLLRERPGQEEEAEPLGWGAAAAGPAGSSSRQRGPRDRVARTGYLCGRRGVPQGGRLLVRPCELGRATWKVRRERAGPGSGGRPAGSSPSALPVGSLREAGCAWPAVPRSPYGVLGCGARADGSPCPVTQFVSCCSGGVRALGHRPWRGAVPEGGTPAAGLGTCPVQRARCVPGARGAAQSAPRAPRAGGLRARSSFLVKC